MENSFKKFLVLENDIELQGLPDVIEDILKIYPNMKKEVWWWFGEDMRQNTEKCFKRFSEVKDDTFIITYPSFVGQGNSFEGKLFVFF